MIMIMTASIRGCLMWDFPHRYNELLKTLILGFFLNIILKALHYEAQQRPIKKNDRSHYAILLPGICQVALLDSLPNP